MRGRRAPSGVFIPGSRSGFSLVEALIAVSLSGVILALVTTVFVAQNRFYQDVAARSALQDNVRSAGELVAAEIRALGEESVLVAESDRLVIRSPGVIGVVCGSQFDNRWVYLPLDGVPASAETTGFGVLWTDGTWHYFDQDWSQLHAASGEAVSAGSCVSAGVDTANVPLTDFVRLNVPAAQGGNWLGAGLPVMLFTNIEFRFAESQLAPGSRALFRGLQGESLTETATGFTSDAGFEYLLDGSWVSEVGSSGLSSIRFVRIAILASRPDGGGVYGRSLEVPLRNAPW